MEKKVRYSSAQRTIIEEDSKFVQVVAAAGSGKTSTMVGILERILRENLFPEESLLVLTFSRKAAGEISERIKRVTGKETIRVQTFHAYCLYALGKWHPMFAKRKPKIHSSEDKNRFYREYLKLRKFEVGGIPYELFWSENAHNVEKFMPELKAELDFAYQNYKRTEGFLDFGDLVSMFLEGLRNGEDWTSEAKRSVQKVLVDEFQDTDLEQLEFLKLLSESASISVVGDDSQAIYGFRGATPVPFLRFKEIFKPCKVHFLNINYRSLPEIVTLADIPIRKNRARIEKTVFPERKGNALTGRILIEESAELIPYFVRSIRSSGGNVKILCRSNFRISEYSRIGIPSEYLMTIHSSKGLEFHTVFVDLADGWNARSDSPEETVEEERRILYVALSRAEDRLIIVGNVKTSRRETIENEFFRYFRKLKRIEPEDLL
ncbi:damage-inducible protein [Leptospira gomenensis]|uniref:DNA 3'-5' helicase n=1 Tax=Leptospira gomenensis TaxID=2484974 RepID=A0A5F1YDQ8_9LEPT|nr:ATP-dependent helicase [Leptospira gomenensis]TGK36409.1 damage-inducible protein [Leptospira gomenensis]TGK38238.1 damage-inducible protein [Leptospira gomenensis]TGK45979.1 damage-inducible protein [Leptospira gomenensis]TGK65243.1 damage-inducible protein [Leptospira gomenensis]